MPSYKYIGGLFIAKGAACLAKGAAAEATLVAEAPALPIRDVILNHPQATHRPVPGFDLRGALELPQAGWLGVRVAEVVGAILEGIPRWE